MRPLVVLCALLFLLAGCQARNQPTPTTTTPQTTSAYLADPDDPGWPAAYDFRAAIFSETNGTLVLNLTFRSFVDNKNGTFVLPAVTARFKVAADQGIRELYVRDEPDLGPNSTGFHLQWVLGHVDQGTDVRDQKLDCHEIHFDNPLAEIDFGIQESAIGLAGGGRITSLRVNTSDFDDHQYDLASIDRDLQLNGWKAAPGDCPFGAHKD